MGDLPLSEETGGHAGPLDASPLSRNSLPVKIRLEHGFQGTVNMPNPETTSSVFRCLRVTVANTRENPPVEPSDHGVERGLSKQAPSRPRQLSDPLNKDVWDRSAGAQKFGLLWLTGLS